MLVFSNTAPSSMVLIALLSLTLKASYSLNLSSSSCECLVMKVNNSKIDYLANHRVNSVSASQVCHPFKVVILSTSGKSSLF
jgi:hypothetical protein